MGTLSRFRHVVSANVNALLERAEDPEKMLKALVREMDDALEEAREAAAGLGAERKALVRRLEGLEEDQQAWAQRAEKALAAGQEDMARQALARRLSLQEEAEGCQRAIEQAESGAGRIKEDIQRLEKRLNEARAKEKELLSQPAVSTIARRYQSPAERRLASVMGRFEGLETRMEQLESRVESYDLGRDAPAPDCPAHSEEIEAELAALKQRMSGESRPEEKS